jgi:deoxyribodipyrimidine photolyase-related protein
MSSTLENDIFILFPNQLFEDIKLLRKYSKVYLLEEPMFFGDAKYRPFNINKVKLAYMVACMQSYKNHLEHQNINVEYIPYSNLIKTNGYNIFNKNNISISTYTTYDIELDNKLKSLIKTKVININSPYFMLSNDDRDEFLVKHPKGTKHTVFYKYAKDKLKIQVLEDVKSQDKYNRENLPKSWKANFKEPNYVSSYNQKYYKFASEYVNKVFPNNIGTVDKVHIYPITFADAKSSLDYFLKHRFSSYGKYQDAMHTDDPILYHSLLSAPLNIGILTPSYVLQYVLNYISKNHDIHVQSYEGFIRQLIWREYEVYIYLSMYDELIKSNHFNNTNHFRSWNALYNGTTSIQPLDDNIKKALEYGYSHHIIRLMIFLNFFTLCEINPHDIYRWFMEVVAIDAYPWVMYSNIFTMGYANPKMMMKPYISTSSYIIKMSNYKRNAEWCAIWDALFYRFLSNKKDKFIGTAKVYLRNLSYFENKSKFEQNNIKEIASKLILKIAK